MADAMNVDVVLQYPIGKLSDKFDRRLVLAATTLATSLAAGAVVLNVSVGNMWALSINAFAHETLMLDITAFIYGSLAFTLYSLAAAQANDLTHPDRLMQTAGGLLIAFGIGAVMGPLVGGFIMDHTGPRSLFVYLMALSLSLFGFTIYRRRTRQAGFIKRFFVPKPETLYSPETLYNAVRSAVDRELVPTAEPQPEPNDTKEDDTPQSVPESQSPPETQSR